MLKVAVVQLYPRPRQMEQNHAKAITFIQAAAKAGANLVVLPEYHLADFEPDDPDFRKNCIHWQRYLDAYCAVAKQCRICVVPGTFTELHRNEEIREEKLINTAYFIDHRGVVHGRYEKKNIWHPERSHLTSSKNTPHLAFDTPLGKVGLLICWDLAFPEAFKALISQGAKTIIIPAFWKLTDATDVGVKRNPASEQVLLDAMVVSRAFENTCAVVFCNATGPSEEGFAGYSQVAVPFQGCIGKLDSNEEAMKIIDVDTDIVEEAESVYKIRGDMANPSWPYKHS